MLIVKIITLTILNISHNEFILIFRIDSSKVSNEYAYNNIY